MPAKECALSKYCDLVTIFGIIFSVLASMGQSNTVFVVNGALSLAAAIVALFIKAPYCRKFYYHDTARAT